MYTTLLHRWESDQGNIELFRDWNRLFCQVKKTTEQSTKIVDLPVHPNISIEAQIAILTQSSAEIKADGGPHFKSSHTPQCEWDWNGKKITLLQKEESWVWQIFDRSAHKTTKFPFRKARLCGLYGIFSEKVAAEMRGATGQDRYIDLDTGRGWIYWGGTTEYLQGVVTAVNIPPKYASAEHLDFIKSFSIKHIDANGIHLQPFKLINPHSYLDPLTWRVSIVTPNHQDAGKATPALLIEAIENHQLQMYLTCFRIQGAQQSGILPGDVYWQQITPSEFSCRVIEEKRVSKDRILKMITVIHTEIYQQNIKRDVVAFYNATGVDDVFQVPFFRETANGLRPVLDASSWVAKKYKIATGDPPKNLSLPHF